MKKTELKNHIIKNGLFDPGKNEKIYDDYFATAPRYIFRAVDKKYHISDRILCDLGCSYGMNLPHCKEGSYGIEVEKEKVEFARKIGLTVFKIDIAGEDISNLPRVEAIWCSHVLEHVDSPHIFLRKIHQLLNPGGLLVLFVPTMPMIPVLQKMPVIGKFVRGYDIDDHINAFVPDSVRFFCERAGFKTIELSPFYPGVLKLFNQWPFFNRLVSRCIYIGQKIADWEYPKEATRKTANTITGYRFV